MKRALCSYLFIVGVFTHFLQAQEAGIKLEPSEALIENDCLQIHFDLTSGSYKGIDKKRNTVIFSDAWFRLDPGENPGRRLRHEYKAEDLGQVNDAMGSGVKLRVWYMSKGIYKPQRFLDITVYDHHSGVALSWGIKNPFDYEVRVRQAELCHEGKLFDNQVVNAPKVLQSGAGAMRNFVEDKWIIDALNGAMLTYKDSLTYQRHTIVGGGLKYKEFARRFETHKGVKQWNADMTPRYAGEQSFLTLTVWDPQGKRIAPHSTWESEDGYYLDFVTQNPFESLEKYGRALAQANNAKPNKYDFPTLCGWMVSTKNYGEGKLINNSPGLVEQMIIAENSGVTKYTPVAVRLEPDYYCYGNQGNTQQGWWDDEHWAKYKSLRKPYETFGKFSKAIQQHKGIVFTYFQVSMPSNDFAMTHPDWMLNKDISLLHVDHSHQFPLIRYDYSHAGFQDYTLTMWKRLREDGVQGIKFDYPETGWARHGGFDNKSYTTTSAYRKIFELCREGLGEDAYIHERILGGVIHESVPQLDCTVGVVDLQRVWGDASHFEPEMASRIGLRWFKQNVAMQYYPDGKSFYFKGEELSSVERRSFLTLIGLLSGRIELGTSFSSMTDEMFYDLTRLFPVLPNGKSFRPVDMLLGKTHPEVYVYDVDESWKQVILSNPEASNPKILNVPLAGDQVAEGAIGLDQDKEYYVFDFWNQKPLGHYRGSQQFSVTLQPKEALVYAFREVKEHPQVIGTSRHVMCGMMELSQVQWEAASRKLTINADLIDGEWLTIFIAKSSNSELKQKKAKDATLKVEDLGQYLKIGLKGNKGITNTQLQLEF
jgi:hypothetical protein